MLALFIFSSTCLHNYLCPLKYVLLLWVSNWNSTWLQQIEREMGSGGFLITYFAAGIFGWVTPGLLCNHRAQRLQ